MRQDLVGQAETFNPSNFKQQYSDRCTACVMCSQRFDGEWRTRVLIYYCNVSMGSSNVGWFPVGLISRSNRRLLFSLHSQIVSHSRGGGDATTHTSRRDAVALMAISSFNGSIRPRRFAKLQ